MNKESDNSFRLHASGDMFRRRTSLGQTVFLHLRKAIVDQTIPPGSRLVETRIADMLGISRTPVREAIHKLEREDWIRRLPRGGYQSMELTPADIEETFGIRSVLESYAARLAAEHNTPEDIQMLEEKIMDYQDCLDRNSQDSPGPEAVDELARINTEFHDQLYQLSRSPRLIRMISSLTAQISRFRHMILQQTGMARQSNDDHRKMVEAIARNDGDAVEQHVREHILRGKKAVTQGLARKKNTNRLNGKESVCHEN